MKTKIFYVVCGLLLVGLVLVILSNIAYRAENNALKAEAQVYVLRDTQSQGRYLAAVSQIGLMEVESEKARAKIAELGQRVAVLAQATAVSPEIVYVKVPAEQVEGPEPPADFKGTWQAETDTWAARFSIPPPQFDVTVKGFEAALEVAITDQGVIFVSSLNPRLTITDVQGTTTIPRPPGWAVEAFGVYPGWELGVVLNRRIWGSLWGVAGIQSDLNSTISGVVGLRLEF